MSNLISSADKSRADFRQSFWSKKRITLSFSPGRINLIGEHTITTAAMCLSCSRLSRNLWGVNQAGRPALVLLGKFLKKEISEVPLETVLKQNNWTNYQKEFYIFCKRLYSWLTEHGLIYVYGNIPNGAGLSSSASLELLTVSCWEVDLNLERT